MENTCKTGFQGNIADIQKLITEIDKALSRPVFPSTGEIEFNKLRKDVRELKRRFDTVIVTLTVAVTALISGFITFIFVSL